MVISVLYVLSPVDFIPDFVPGFGLVDDAGAFATFVGLVISILKDKKKRQQSAEGNLKKITEP